MENRAVSPVVGTILLITITVALAAVVATLVSGLGGRGTPPSAFLDVTAKVNVENNECIDLTIIHNGGDDLVINDLKISATVENGTFRFDFPGTDIFESFSKRVVTYYFGAVVPDNQLLEVSIIHWPSRSKIWEGHVVKVEPLPPVLIVTPIYPPVGTIEGEIINVQLGDSLILITFENSTGKFSAIFQSTMLFIPIGENVRLAYHQPITGWRANNTPIRSGWYIIDDIRVV